MSTSAADSVDARPDVIRFLAWSRVWSPLPAEELRAEAWYQLDLPGDLSQWRGEFLRTFHVALPQPAAPLQLHAALARDGGTVREDFVRVMDYLQLEYDDAGRLPPDHLACACELYALALHLEEPVLVEGLRARYLLPWVEAVAPAVAASPAMAAIVARFGEDLGSSA